MNGTSTQFTIGIVAPRQLPGGLSPTDRDQAYPVFTLDGSVSRRVVIFPWTVSEDDESSLGGWPVEASVLRRINPDMSLEHRATLEGHGAWYMDNSAVTPASDEQVRRLYGRWPHLHLFDVDNQTDLGRNVARLAERLGRKHRWCQAVRDDVERGLRELGITMPGHERTISMRVELDRADDVSDVVNDLTDTINRRAGVRLVPGHPVQYRRHQSEPF